MKYILSVFSVALLLLCGCAEEEIKNSDANGWLSVDFLTDKSLTTKADLSTYKLVIAKPDGSPFATYENCTGISDRIYMPVGAYTVTASQGAEVASGFDAPFYKTEENINIESAVTKAISLVCTQANIKMTVGYSEVFKNNFTDYSLKVINGNADITFAKNESRAGYLMPTENTIKWELTLNNGQETYNLTKTLTNVAPRQHYKFFFDIKEDGDENDGAFVPGITVDTTTNIINSEYEIIIIDTISKASIKRSDDKAFAEPCLVLNETRGVNLALNIDAKASIQDMWLQHNSNTAEALGLPKDIRFMTLTADDIAQINGAGITWGGETILDAKALSMDFSALLNKLPLGDYEFKLSVFDARQRLTTETLKVMVIPDIDHIADEISTPEVWAKFATIRGRWYTIDRPEGFAIEYSTDQITWTPATNVTYNDGSKTCSAFIKDLAPATTYYFRTTSATVVSETVREFNTEAANQVPYMNFDNWYMDGKSPMVGESANNIIWDSGNKGGAGFGYTPTTEETTDVIKGSAVRMQTQYAVVKLAAGNIYTGKFVDLSGLNALLDFGTPYQGRPTTMSGYYKYKPVKVDKGTHAGMSGKQDSCHIYIALLDWTAAHRINSGNTSTLVDLSTNNKSIIAFAELKESKVMEQYEAFTLQLEYRDKTKQPSYILVVASASKYGDYFTGGVGSTLWIDEFSLGFDPVE
ncbi:MAG: PCMD domain-containing protein [Marinifilaceae bacterium]